MTGPTTERQRHVILDALRGLALMGIALANFPEFALWTFLSSEQQAAMPTAYIDEIVRFLQYLVVDGKFYSIFSILFGIGLSLIMIPVGLDALIEFGGFDFPEPFYQAWWNKAEALGINEANFASWLRDANSYGQMFAFLVQGAYERLWEFVEGHRLPKVVGLFILGYLASKHRLYARLQDLPLRKALYWSVSIGLPTSLLYAWSATSGHPGGLTVHSLLYAVSVIPLAIVFIIGACLLYLQNPKSVVFRWLAAPGRMALSCYISHSLIGVLLFYGLGFGLGTSLGLVYIELIALVVFFIQIIVCRIWLNYFRFGPLEWLWRMLTYGRYFPIIK